ncbi:DUF6332 family protein [Streptomyces sp. NPDC058467]|uniref:DUF6332 family protein n=1 Tax=Streptomyces sp. NPDC058467 TaxID=3346513 RepID=UPI00366837E9
MNPFPVSRQVLGERCPFSGGAVRTLVASGATLAAVLFVLRVATVLVRFRYEGGAAQPSQPGRTSPDS